MAERPTRACAMCIERGKTWNGGDPVCSFPDGGQFSPGWNCATAGAVRDICGGSSDDEHPELVCDEQKLDWRFCDDQKYATITVNQVDLPGGSALALWVSWYNRSRTEAMWLLDEYEPPRRPTEADAVAIIAALAPHTAGPG